MVFMTRAELLQTKREDILRIARMYGAMNIRVFGSVSRREDRAQSDIDLLVRLDPGRSLLDIVALKQDLQDLLGCEVDVVTEDAVSPYIREQVLKDASNL